MIAVYKTYLKNLGDRNRTYAVCRCSFCSSIFERSYSDVSKTKSCGCQKNKIMDTRVTDNNLYSTHRSMINRCHSKKSNNYVNYGARGISVCDRWAGPDGLENFTRDMGPKSEASLTLDRINNDGNYEPGNCRWAARSIQSVNKRSSGKIKSKGVWFRSGKFVSSIKLNGNPIYIGRFKTEREASNAYLAKRKEIYGF